MRPDKDWASLPHAFSQEIPSGISPGSVNKDGVSRENRPNGRSHKVELKLHRRGQPSVGLRGPNQTFAFRPSTAGWDLWSICTRGFSCSTVTKGHRPPGLVASPYVVCVCVCGCSWVTASEEYLLDAATVGVGPQHHSQGDVHVFAFKQLSS